MINKKKILLADDHVIIRRGLKVLLDNYFGQSDWVETEFAKNIPELIEKNELTHLILDMQLQDANILEVISTIKSLSHTLPILIYTMSSEEIFGPRMMNLGVNGYLSKQSGEEEVLKAFHTFFAGRNYFSESLLELVSKKTYNSQNPLNSLSEREISVLNYLLKGNSVKEITEILDLKTSTVATYKGRIFDKLGVNNIIDLRNITDIYNTKIN
ncbi:MAG: LuxR C-terminal-related transcriptional regulator [Candidatus Methylacidiphilales bacterium]